MEQWPISVMLYGAGEAINGSGALAPAIRAQLERLSKVATNAHVAATAQLDSSSVPTARYVVDPAGRQPIYQIDNVDVGDPQELVDFVRWSAGTCPAKQHVLVLSGHGAAWEDTLMERLLGFEKTRLGTPFVFHKRSIFSSARPQRMDTRFVLVDGSNRNYLSNAELGIACERAAAACGGKLDVVVFDACLMSSWEVLVELGSSVSTVVAAMDELSASGIDLSRPVSKLTAAGGLAGPREIAATIASEFTPLADFDTCIALDLESAAFRNALDEFRSFCARLQPWIEQSPNNAQVVRDSLGLAASRMVRFQAGGIADVGGIATELMRAPTVPADAKDLLERAVTSLSACVLAKSAGAGYRDGLGVSIFSPDSARVFAVNLPEYRRLRFANATGWGQVLESLYPGVAAATSTTDTRVIGALGRSDAEADDAEFVISLRGVPLAAETKGRVTKAIGRVVLEELGRLDALGDATVAAPGEFAKTRLLRLGADLGSTAGMVVVANPRGCDVTNPES